MQRLVAEERVFWWAPASDPNALSRDRVGTFRQEDGWPVVVWDKPWGPSVQLGIPMTATPVCEDTRYLVTGGVLAYAMPLDCPGPFTIPTPPPDRPDPQHPTLDR